MSRSPFLSALARSMLAGELALEPVSDRMRRTLGRDWHWLQPLARSFLAEFGSGPRPTRNAVRAFLAREPILTRARRKYKADVRIAHWFCGPQPMQPAPAAVSWDLPRIETAGELAAWLQLSPGELEWLADLKHLASRLGEARLSHYRYRALAKGDGAIRLIEAPKRRLKEIQRTILREILAHIPPHPAAHGFVHGRSIKTFATVHAGQDVVLRMDLKDFFPSISGARVEALFRTAGYPETVAALFSGICTNAVPHAYWRSAGAGWNLEQIRDAREIYSRAHLPQGAPTSPALANMLAYRVDCRLEGLAHAAGAHYTRYADDLAFSGGLEFARSFERFSVHAAAILLEEGFAAHHRKTRVMRRGVRQHLAGIVVNERTNVQRGEFDRLKATLTNCARHGAESQNREGCPLFRSHLQGRISFVTMINPAKGARLNRIFDRIQW
jgi:RNA-directed DNA polymerase